MNDFLKRVDDRLHELRRKRPWLAEQSGIKVGTIHSWFGKDRIPDIEDAARLSDALGVSLDWLVTGEEPEKRHEDPIIAEMCDYLEGLTANELAEAFGVLKHARIMKLSSPSVDSERAPDDAAS